MEKSRQSADPLVLVYRAQERSTTAEKLAIWGLWTVCGFGAAGIVEGAATELVSTIGIWGFRELIATEACVAFYAIFMTICGLCCNGNRRRFFFTFVITAIACMIFRWEIAHITFAPEPMHAQPRLIEGTQRQWI